MAKSKTRGPAGIVDRLVDAARGRTVSQQKPWDYGWSIPDYRRSATAAMTHDERRGASLDAAAVVAFEEAIEAMLRLPEVRDQYDGEEFWSLMAGLVGTLPIPAAREEIERRVQRVLAPRESLVVLPLANVAKVRAPISLAAATIGPFGNDLATRLRGQAGNATPDRPATEPWWVDATGHTPLGREPDDLVKLMRAQQRRR